jgi:hypothetical protein
MSTYPPNMTLRPLDGWPLDFTAERKRSRFESSFSATLELLDRELGLIDPTFRHYPPSVLQIALREQDFRRDGMPRAGSVTEHPGVILNIEPRNKPALSFPCDTFTHWHDNLRAITLTLEALRKIDRYGVTQTGQQYRGWQAIEAPRPPSSGRVIGAAHFLILAAFPDQNGDIEQWARNIADLTTGCHNVYRKARANSHPDRHNGDRTLWNDVEAAAAVLRTAGCAL